MPNRLIKEAVWTSPNLNQVSDLAERHFYRLLPLPDDHGCCEVTPLVVKGRCYPLRNKVTPEMIQKWNGELESVDIIRTWEVLGRIYGWFPKWSEHQRIRSLHQRKTPEPPSEVVNGQRLATSDNSDCHSHLNPNPIPILNPDLNPISPSEKSDKPTSSKKTHPRLGIFLEEYKNSTGRDYIVGNYREEGGAAKGTENKIPDETLYRQAVRAYLSAVDKRIVEASFPYLWFIRDLNRWVGVAQERGSHGTDKYTGFAGKDYSEGTW